MSDYAASPQEKKVCPTDKEISRFLTSILYNQSLYIGNVSKYIDTGKYNGTLAVLLNYFPTIT
jgi:hypothetical protein